MRPARRAHSACSQSRTRDCWPASNASSAANSTLVSTKTTAPEVSSGLAILGTPLRIRPAARTERGGVGHPVALGTGVGVVMLHLVGQHLAYQARHTGVAPCGLDAHPLQRGVLDRSEEHTSELQSQSN